MTKLNKIKTFVFDTAQYRIGDSRGAVGMLVVNYFENTFKIVGNELESGAKKEISAFAKDLLKRKHGKNFADKTL